MIKISFNEPSATFAPGDPINGTVTWKSVSEDTSHFEIRLIWFTSGKGSIDVEVVDSISVAKTAAAGETEFKFTAPTRPFSFSAKLISLNWSVEVVEFPSCDGHKQNFVLSSDRNEIFLKKSFDSDLIKKPFIRSNHTRR